MWRKLPLLKAATSHAAVLEMEIKSLPFLPLQLPATPK
jgi:hypothetical protein